LLESVGLQRRSRDVTETIDDLAREFAAERAAGQYLWGMRDAPRYLTGAIVNSLELSLGMILLSKAQVPPPYRHLSDAGASIRLWSYASASATVASAYAPGDGRLAQLSVRGKS
jgi:hypothetical protein